MKHLHRYNSNLSFIDMLFIMVLGFVFLLFLSLVLMNPPTKKNDIETRAEFIITMSWPDDSPHDVDMWCLTPDLDKIGFLHRENSYVNLERDDLGQTNDQYVIGGSSDKKVIEVNREVISIRARIPGRYVVNAYLFSRKASISNPGPIDLSPIPVTVELVQVHPTYKILERRTIVLERTKEEKTAFVFTIDSSGQVNDIQITETPFLAEDFGLGAGGFEPNFNLGR